MPNYSFVQLPGNGVTKNFAFTFPYLNKTHVTATVDGVNTLFTWLTNSIIRIDPAPVNGSVVEIRRRTPLNETLVDYSNGSVLVESDLDASNLQALFLAQETEDTRANSILLNAEGVYDATSRRIANVADPSQPEDAATKEYVDAQFAASPGGHALFAHSDADAGASVAAGSLLVGDDQTPSKVSTVPVGGKGSLLIGKPAESKRIAWVPVGDNYAHLLADSGKSDGLRWVPSTTFTSQDMELLVGTGDNQALLTAGVTALPASGGRLHLGPGTFQFATGLTIGKPVIIEGCGRGVTILEMTTLANLQHFFALSRSAIFRNLTLKVSSAHPGVDYAMNAIRLDLYGGGVSNQFLICDNVEILDFDMGFYADGGGIDTESSLIDYVLYRNCRARITSAVDIPRGPASAHRCYEVNIQDCVWDSQNNGDHCLYAIRNKRISVVGTTHTNSPYHGVKIISNPGDAGMLDQWSVNRSRFINNDTPIVTSITASLKLDQLNLNDNSIEDSTPRGSSISAVWVVAADTSEIRKVSLNNLIARDCSMSVASFDVGASARIRHVVMNGPTCINWGVASAGTYAAVTKNGAGPLDCFQMDDGYFDGNSNGKRPSNLEVSGVIPQYGKIFATGCTDMPTSVTPPNSPVGTSGNMANSVGVLARLLTQASTAAGTTEQDLWATTVKANSLAKNGATLTLKAWGRFAGNGNAKTLRVRWDSNLMIYNDVNPTPNGAHWELEVTIMRTGASAQRCFGRMTVAGAVQTNIDGFQTVVETADKVLKVTGQDGTSSAGDITVNGGSIEFSE